MPPISTSIVRLGLVGLTVATVPNFQFAAVPPAGAAVPKIPQEHTLLKYAVHAAVPFTPQPIDIV